jgi:hypothetical protein
MALRSESEWIERPLRPPAPMVGASVISPAPPTVPELPAVVDELFDSQDQWRGSSLAELRTDARESARALARLVHGDLAGLVDGPSSVALDPALPMVSLDLQQVSGSDTLLGLIMTCASTWMEAVLRDPSGGQRLVIYDGAWRLMAQPALLARMQAQWKLSRAWGSPTS